MTDELQQLENAFGKHSGHMTDLISGVPAARKKYGLEHNNDTTGQGLATASKPSNTLAVAEK